MLSLALSLLTITLIYTYVPGGKRRIRDQLPGAAAVVAVWTLFSKIFSFYIGISGSYRTFTVLWLQSC